MTQWYEINQWSLPLPVTKQERFISLFTSILKQSTYQEVHSSIETTELAFLYEYLKIGSTLDFTNLLKRCKMEIYQQALNYFGMAQSMNNAKIDWGDWSAYVLASRNLSDAEFRDTFVKIYGIDSLVYTLQWNPRNEHRMNVFRKEIWSLIRVKIVDSEFELPPKDQMHRSFWEKILERRCSNKDFLELDSGSQDILLHITRGLKVPVQNDNPLNLKKDSLRDIISGILRIQREKTRKAIRHCKRTVDNSARDHFEIPDDYEKLKSEFESAVLTFDDIQSYYINYVCTEDPTCAKQIASIDYSDLKTRILMLHGAAKKMEKTARNCSKQIEIKKKPEYRKQSRASKLFSRMFW